jgi:hypothetical protein
MYRLVPEILMPLDRYINGQERLGISGWAATPLLGVEHVQAVPFPSRIAPIPPWRAESKVLADLLLVRAMNLLASA